ncbi:hypothetical protein SHDE107825_18445 [Shewanella denitrificans]|jgi:hypothetical protein
MNQKNNENRIAPFVKLIPAMLPFLVNLILYEMGWLFGILVGFIMIIISYKIPIEYIFYETRVRYMWHVCLFILFSFLFYLFGSLYPQYNTIARVIFAIGFFIFIYSYAEKIDGKTQ